MSEELKHTTRQLIELLDRVEVHRKRALSRGETADFETEIRPFTMEVLDVLERWKLLATQWIEEKRPKTFHVMQIEQTIENMHRLSLLGFDPKASALKFQQHVESTRYNFTRFLTLVEETEK
ncbi:DUF1798 family protein [Bacillus fonticola]|uniref:DUF1798 family protein n=1 Tax=Bacillus fonticola TaxID=2728853 RepID=UPI0014728E3F|nr:DUF1798 family protein [Bacillus fonticola]